MVFKEEVLSWFKDLESYKRIDVLYELLNMLMPFELRFLGTCVEEIGKHTYQELRGPAITANDLEKLSKDVSFNSGLLEESVRHRVLICLSLLSSRNYSVANWLYKTLLRTPSVEDFIVNGIVKEQDEHLKSEFLLLFTMAIHHPAFTFEQKQFFGRILTQLFDFRENKSRTSPKPSVYGYPPGFGYPTQLKPNLMEPPAVPVKTAGPMSYGDTPTLHQQPPGLHHIPHPHPAEFALWSRPGIPCGAPEMTPFSHALSPQVSQAGSPNHSRSTSPLRTAMTVRPPPPVMPPPPPVPVAQVEVLAPPPPVPQLPPPLDQLSQSSLPPIFSATDLKMPPEDELMRLQDEKQLRDVPWGGPGLIPPEMKQPNGLRYNVFHKPIIRPSFLTEQMQAMNLDGENSLHQSNSSSNSSPNQTPPGTPSSTPAATPHGPGRGSTPGDGKPRVNGMPPPFPPPGPSICDTTSPPPAAAFNNCTVPYSYPQSFPAMPPPNRSMFPYNQGFRPAFTAQYPSYPTENFASYTYPYLIYSSQPFPSRTPPNCYNCGAPGHVGPDCTAQNIEEITQKKTYQLDFAATLPDTDK